MSLVRFRSEAPCADLAHLVERNLAKVEVAGSIPVIRSKIKRHTPLCAPQKPIRKRNGKAVKKNAPMGNHGQFFSVILRYQAHECRIDFRQTPNITRMTIRRHSQAVRQRSAKPSSPVRFRVAPPKAPVDKSLRELFTETCQD